jgi:hypothetical protein
MKKKLILTVQIVVSVVILAYLFHSIFEREATEELKALATEPAVSDAEHARRFGLAESQIARIRQQCVTEMEGEPAINLAALPLKERASIVWQIGPHGLWAVFQTISPAWFGLALLCFGMVCLLGTLRWQRILRVQGLDIGFARTSSIFFIGHFFNAFMLGSTGGDLIKAWYVAHETHHKKAEAVTTVVVDRLIGLLALFLIALIMMTIFHQRVFEDRRLVWFAIFTLAVVLATVLGTIIGFWKGFADRFPWLRRTLERLPKYEMLQRMVAAYRTYASHPAVLLQTLLYSFGVHVASMLVIVCVAQGLQITAADIVDYFLYLPIIGTLSAVPISFSGFGVREGMYVQMFAQVNMPAVQALTLSLLGYIVGLVWSIVGGGFFLTHRKEVSAIEKEGQTTEA